jgi:hypothetical protein
VSGSPIASRICWIRSDLTFEMPPGGSPPRPLRPARADGLPVDVAPVAEALAQAQEGDVAVAVVRRLRQDGEDELVERRVVRARTGVP